MKVGSGPADTLAGGHQARLRRRDRGLRLESALDVVWLGHVRHRTDRPVKFPDENDVRFPPSALGDTVRPTGRLPARNATETLLSLGDAYRRIRWPVAARIIAPISRRNTSIASPP